MNDPCERRNARNGLREWQAATGRRASRRERLADCAGCVIELAVILGIVGLILECCFPR